MRIGAKLPLFVVCAALAAFTPAPTGAAEPETLIPSSYIVNINRTTRTAEVTFLLALGEVSPYPVTIIASGGSEEEELWRGNLPGGAYRIKLPINKIKKGPVKIILKTKVYNRKAGGTDVFIVHLVWEGVL